VSVVCGMVEKEFEGNGMLAHAVWVPIEVGSCSECVRLECKWCRSMQQHSVHVVIEGTQRELGTAVMLGCVWTCEFMNNVVGNKKGTSGMVVKFFA
jgi:hypothetical protein